MKDANQRPAVIEGLLAMVLPNPVSICPMQDGWGVLIYGDKPTPENPSGIVERHMASTIEEAKRWATERLTALHGVDVAHRIDWEPLVCKPGA